MTAPEGEVTPTSDGTAHSLLLRAAPYSVSSSKTPGWTLSHPALVQCQCAPVILDMLLERSKHLQRLTHLKAQGWIFLQKCCFSPLIRQEDLEFQHTQNPWLSGGCIKGLLPFARPMFSRWHHQKCTSERLDSFRDLTYSAVTQMLSWYSKSLSICTNVTTWFRYVKLVICIGCSWCWSAVLVMAGDRDDARSDVSCGNPPWIVVQEERSCLLCLLCQGRTLLLLVAHGLSGTPAAFCQASRKNRKTKSCSCDVSNILFWGDDTRM